MDQPASDPKPDEDILFVRASAASQCNLNCIYCPKESGMENFVPDRHRNHRLSTSQYCRNLDHLAASGVIQGISFTGGEPTLNTDLPDLVAHARSLFRRVELTTNGRFLLPQLDRLARHVDVLKVSLDTVDPDMSHEIMRGQRVDHGRALDAVRAALGAGVTVGINLVAMKRNIDQVAGVVALASRLREETSGDVYVSVLDLYYSDEQKQLWLDEFIPLNDIIREFHDRLGDGVWQDRRGCEMSWFDAGGVQVRFKNSYASTYRAPRCERCPVYCQEGFYGLKHSVEGWVTPCPSNAEEFGVHLAPGLSDEEARQRLEPLMREFGETRRVYDSFEQFLNRRGLTITV